MADDFLDYPKGRIAQGAGDLQDVSDFTIAYQDGEKHVNTLRRQGAGSTSGPRNVTLSFTSKISELGFERNYMRNYRRRIPILYRLKVAVHTFTIKGRLTNLQIVSNIDGEITFTASVVGKDQDDT